ncbi:MAG: NAD(P)H-hydrate dehydratase [Planctomycetes bacterium]|nr:NAD(P)H-hydrate dehydratase [Planctomycetota bacterium]
MQPADLPKLPRRQLTTSKRDYGRVVIVGGAAGMAGAPALAAMAALRSGAGLVELIVPEPVAAIVAGFDPCVMTRGLPAQNDGTFARAALKGIEARTASADAVAVGPGIGRSDAVLKIVWHLWRHLPQTAVFDADALWALAASDRGTLATHAGPRILTPHAGEMLRLLGADPSSANADGRLQLERAAADLAGAIDAVIVLKGSATLIVDRTRQTHNNTGNPGMATAGTGDVLTGVTAALVAQRLSLFDAARLAAWVHGRAGDAAAESSGEISMTARDLIDHLHVAFREATA